MLHCKQAKVANNFSSAEFGLQTSWEAGWGREKKKNWGSEKSHLDGLCMQNPAQVPGPLSVEQHDSNSDPEPCGTGEMKHELPSCPPL